MNAEIQKNIERCQSLPTLPAVAIEVLQLSQKGDFSLADMGKVVQKDPAMAAKILKVANSPLFALRREVTTGSQAVVWLGLQSVRTLALSFSLVRGLRKQDKGGFDHFKYWRRSILSALVARELAVRKGLVNWEEVFLGALLQDIGMLILHSAFGERYGKLLQESQGSHVILVDQEKQELACDHADVGLWMARKWTLPEVLCQLIGSSHTKSRVHDSHPEICEAIHCIAVSGLVADIWVEDDPAYATSVARSWVSELFEEDDTFFEKLLAGVAELIPETGALFDVELGAPEQVLSILDQARETLVLLSLQNTQRIQVAEQAIDHLEQRTRALEDQNQRDGLTGLYNRVWMDQSMDRTFMRASHQGQHLSVMFCDIDHFKSVNDNYGHSMGDEVLKRVAGLLQSAVRCSDSAVRYGGEEFVLVLPNTNLEAAMMVAERIRAGVEQLPITLKDGRTLRITISLGVATHSPSTSFTSSGVLLETADEALYRAKRSGRNRVCTYIDEVVGACA